MKIVVVGATGTIGQAVVKAIGTDHEIIKASRNGDVITSQSTQEEVAIAQ